MTTQEPRWPGPWVRACLDLAILSSICGGDSHGYAIAGHLAERGMGRLKGGSLYPALARLEQDGLIEAGWIPGEQGPGRKTYTLTADGRTERERLLASWRDLTDTLGSLGQATDRSM